MDHTAKIHKGTQSATIKLNTRNIVNFISIIITRNVTEFRITVDTLLWANSNENY